MEDPGERGQSAAAAAGIERALAAGVERVLCVPGDCPALDPAELSMLLAVGAGAGAGNEADAGADGAGAGTAGAGVVVIPDRHGTGTNGLLLHPPEVIEPSFGPGSCERHQALAAAAGVPCRLEHPSSLLLDVDTGADLEALRERLAGHPGRARRTRAVLGPEAASAPTLGSTA